MKKLFITTIMSLIFYGNISAQETIEEIEEITEENVEKIAERPERKNAIGISFGFPGFGIDYARKLSDKFSAKVRYHTFKVEDYDTGKYDISGNSVDAIFSGESNTIDLLVEYLPFKSSSFKLVWGIGIINKMNLNILMEYDESVAFGDVILTKEDYGNVGLGFEWSGVAPYLGLGFGRAVPNSRFGFSIEGGSYFSTSPKMTLEATKLLAPKGDQIEEVEETFKTWKFIPLVQFRVVYAF